MRQRNLIGIIAVIAVIVIAIIYFTRTPGTGPVASPAGETAFISGMQPIMTQAALPNADLNSWRQKRAALICQAIPDQQVTNWTGTVVNVDSTITGGAVLAIAVLPNVDFGTAPNAISNISSNTLISQGSPLYATISALHVGQKVSFSGQLFASQDDCIQEASVTIGGSMRNPLFVTRFTSITPLS